MHKISKLAVLVLLFSLVFGSQVSFLLARPSEPKKKNSERLRNWPQWRGPNMDGVSPFGQPPVKWSETENISWKIAVAGLGASTPIVWKNLVLLQTAIPVTGANLETDQKLEEWQRDGTDIFQGDSYVLSRKKQQFALIAVNRENGNKVWQKVLNTVHPHEGIHPSNTWASASPVTDGEYIVSFFGSHGLYVLNTKGDLVWQKDLGNMETRRGWGEGSSPAVHGDKIVVNWDHEGESFILALDKRTGEERWRQERDERSSWFTPLVTEVDGKPQVITTGANHTRAYELETGRLLWSGPGLTVNCIPTPISASGTAFLTSGYRGAAFLAVNLEQAQGDLEKSGAIAWRYDQDTPYVASPVLYQNTLYFTKHMKGILTSLDAATGQPIFGPVRLKGMKVLYASPVAANGHLYFLSRDGLTTVLKHGPELDVVATNQLDGRFDASPAVAGDDIYLRSAQHLYKIGKN